MKEQITISLDEYKELLIIKGKYEEQKKNIPTYVPIYPTYPRPLEPYYYKWICGDTGVLTGKYTLEQCKSLNNSKFISNIKGFSTACNADWNTTTKSDQVNLFYPIL